MKEFENARMEYEETPVPEELNDRVQAGIRQGRANRARRIWKRRLGTVAACFVVVVGALNLSPTVAAAAAAFAAVADVGREFEAVGVIEGVTDAVSEGYGVDIFRIGVGVGAKNVVSEF